jgi:hypothetical protein
MTTAPFIAIALALATVPQAEREGLRRVAPGYEDFSPIALSRQLEPVDNRATLFAEDVYEGERPGRFGSSERVYVRMYGGIVAVFPRSSYVDTPWGVEAEIPAGTVFHLGSAAEALAGAAPGPAPSARPGQVSLRQNLAADTGSAAPAAGRESLRPIAGEQEAAPPSIFTSEPYRQRRMAALLAEAARAERAAR